MDNCWCMQIQVISFLVDSFVRKSDKGGMVKFVEMHLCTLSNAVIQSIFLKSNKVYINTRTIKHIYDKRPAEEFDFLVQNIHLVLLYPNQIYKNKDGARGEYCLIKTIRGDKYLCSLQITYKENVHKNEIVTFFRTGDSYLRNYKLLWEWKDGNLHRNAFDAGFTQSTSTPQ